MFTLILIVLWVGGVWGMKVVNKQVMTIEPPAKLWNNSFQKVLEARKHSYFLTFTRDTHNFLLLPYLICLLTLQAWRWPYLSSYVYNIWYMTCQKDTVYCLVLHFWLYQVSIFSWTKGNAQRLVEIVAQNWTFKKLKFVSRATAFIQIKANKKNSSNIRASCDCIDKR